MLKSVYSNNELYKNQTYSNCIRLLPSIGIMIFLGLFFYAAHLYPGGSQADLNTIGYDWLNNYWCNLMNIKAMNGHLNPARPYSIFAFIILCSSLGLFFIYFSTMFAKNKIWSYLIKIFGVTSMLFGMLIFTKHHDIMTTLSSIFGVIAVIGVLVELYHSRLTFFKIFGVVCVVFLGINNYIYYSQNFISFLPLIQKITFVLVLTWVVGLNYNFSIKKS